MVEGVCKCWREKTALEYLVKFYYAVLAHFTLKLPDQKVNMLMYDWLLVTDCPGAHCRSYRLAHAVMSLRIVFSGDSLFCKSEVLEVGFEEELSTMSRGRVYVYLARK